MRWIGSPRCPRHPPGGHRQRRRPQGRDFTRCMHARAGRHQRILPIHTPPQRQPLLHCCRRHLPPAAQRSSCQAPVGNGPYLNQTVSCWPDAGVVRAAQQRVRLMRVTSQLPVLMASYAVPDPPGVQVRPGQNRRFQGHLTSVSASWLDRVVVRLGIVEARLCTGPMPCPWPELNARIRAFVTGWNDRCYAPVRDRLPHHGHLHHRARRRRSRPTAGAFWTSPSPAPLGARSRDIGDSAMDLTSRRT